MDGPSVRGIEIGETSISSSVIVLLAVSRTVKYNEVCFVLFIVYEILRQLIPRLVQSLLCNVTKSRI